LQVVNKLRDMALSCESALFAGLKRLGMTFDKELRLPVTNLIGLDRHSCRSFFLCAGRHEALEPRVSTYLSLKSRPTLTAKIEFF
jgi:hypothetical protein